MPPDRTEVAGVGLGDVFRDRDGQLWEVISLCTEPQATVQRIGSEERESHVIGCLNWRNKWAARLREERLDG